MKKYEFTGETMDFCGVTLKRIRAVRDFSSVHSGDVGGWIEKEENLDHDGNAWVSGDARVYGDAWVYGDARVYGNAWVSGDARVYGDAWVYGDARVYGDAWVSGDAWVYGYARVYGDAQVYGDARVYGDAWVYGYARVYGDAQVYGSARVSGDARVHGGKWGKSPLYIQGTRWSINISSPNTVRCGCQNHTFQEWHDHYVEISAEHGGDDVLVEYIPYFNLICEMCGHEDCKIV